MDAVWIRVIAAAVIAYFCGCFNGAVIVSKYILRDDVRTHGSGNAGLTNFYRTFGGPPTFVVILTDVLKAVVEGYYAVDSARELAAQVGVEMPITLAAYDVLYRDRDPREVLLSLMRREKRHEIEETWF